MTTWRAGKVHWTEEASADHFDYMDDWHDGGIALDPDRDEPWIEDDQHGEAD